MKFIIKKHDSDVNMVELWDINSKGEKNNLYAVFHLDFFFDYPFVDEGIKQYKELKFELTCLSDLSGLYE